MRWVFGEGPAEMAGEVRIEESAWWMKETEGGGRRKVAVAVLVALFR